MLFAWVCEKCVLAAAAVAAAYKTIDMCIGKWNER